MRKKKTKMNGKKEKRIGLLKRGCAWMLMAALVFGQPQTALAECRSENTKRTEEFSLPENAEEVTYPAEEETPEKMLNTVMTDEADSASEGISSPDESEGNAVGEDPASDGDSTNDESPANDENSKDAGDPIIDGYPEVDENLAVDGDPTVDGDLAGGRYQNIEWRIDANGKLIVTGSTINQWGRQSVIKGFWPWGNQDTPRLVKSAEIRLADAVDLSGMFRRCTNMESVDFSGTDTSQVTDMSDMFDFNDSLTAICFGDSFDTSKVTDMSGMFGECMKLESLDVSGFDTSKVTDMSGMFGGCRNLKTLDVSGFDTSKVTNMRWMFNGCRNLKGLDLSGFRTDRVTDFSFMFNGCTGLEKLDLKGFNTVQATDMQYMFSGCENLTKLNLTGFQTGKVTTMSGMFGGLKSLKTLDVSGFDTSCVTEMNGMFDSCESLETLDVSGFQTGAVRSMLGMFSGCRQVQMLDVSGFDTSLVTDMQSMFYNCESIRELELSHFSTSLVTSMDSMFYGCRKLKKLDLSSFDTTHVTNMTMMVFYCDALEELDLESFDMSVVEESYPPCENSMCPDCRYMFRSQNLARIRTPKHLLFYIELPTSGWKLNGAPVTNLPYNRDESVLLTRSGNSKAPAITSILLDQQAVQLSAGETVNLTAKISPEGADPSRLIWSSSDEEVAKVEGNSTVAVVTGGEKAGSAQITVRSGSVRAVCQVTVRVPLAFDRKKITFTAREGAASSFKLLADASDRDRIQMTVTDGEGAALTDFLEITKDPSEEGRYTVCLQPDAVISETRTAVIRASLNKDDREYQAACTVCVNPLPVTASPGADVPSGTVKINTPVSLRTSTRGAIIFYTTDGTDPVTGTDRTNPGETALPYQDPIRVTKDMTIKAAAVRQDYQTGETAAFVYTVDSGAWGDVIDEGLKSLFDGKAQLVPDGLWIAFRTEDGWDGKIYTASVPEGAPASFTDTLSTGLHMTYTGEKLSPSDRMEVYHGTRRLSENRDYTVSCVNNLHASDLSANGSPNKAPTVTVRGKGNYGGSRSFTFAIEQAPMRDATVEEGTDKTVPAAKKMRLNRIKPTVRYEGQLLKAGRDYSMTYYEGDTVSEEHRIADPSKVKLTEAGKDYCIRISASVNGDFTGECAEVVRVHTIEGKQDPADPGQKISMTKVKIAGLAASVEYTGGIITPEDLFRADKITQNPGADGPWKEVTLYRTDPATKKKLVLTRSADGVTGDYYIKMSASAATGKRVITFIGINGYSGRIKRTITVKPYHVKNNTGGRILVEDPAPAVFCKSGAKPSLTVRFVTEWKRDADNRPTGEPAASVLLKEGIDYLPLYQNNKQVDESGTHVFVSIRGIGNFTGSGQRKGFAVNKASITEQVTLTADDVIWRENGKDGYFKVMPTLTDGAAALKIAKNKDVEPIDKAALNYEYAEDTVLSDGVTRRYKGETALDTDRPAPGTWIRVSAGVTCGPHSPYFCDEGKEAVLEGYYRIIGEGRSIAGYIVEVRPSDHLVFCGADAVIPCKTTDLIVREKGKGAKNANPLAARDIEILSADNNRFPGTARLLLHGLGEYGGYKTISFRIRSRRFDG